MLFFFFFNDTATTEIYTLSLHDALPISGGQAQGHVAGDGDHAAALVHRAGALLADDEQAVGVGLVERAVADGQRADGPGERSEEHTSELQSRQYLVCRLLLEKKKEMYPA